MTERVPVAVIGAGFSGIAVAVGLLRAGVDGVVVLERAEDVGGTWRDNSYPGCACDVPSHLYSLSFAPNPSWSRAFSPQAEILDYLRGVALEHGVLPHVRFGAGVSRAEWDDLAQCWHLTTASGPVDAEVLVAAGGGLSQPAMPDIVGLETFGGTLVHSARWPADLDLAGRRVAVIGTGASAVQVVPAVVDQVAQLSVFQRTPAWVAPRRDRPIPASRQRLYRRLPLAQRVVRGTIYASREVLGGAFTRNSRMLDLVERVLLRHLHAQVADPALRAALTPSYRVGCKRVLSSDDFYPALTRPHVELVTSPIQRVTSTAVVTADGREHEVDVIVAATGFAVYGTEAAEMIRGADGRTLVQHWAQATTAYLGTTVAGFPNLFLMTGPNTGQGHTSMVYLIESQARYVVDAVQRMRAEGIGRVEVRPQVQDRFNDELSLDLARTVWTAGGCHSWYLDEHGRNGTLWPRPTFSFRRRTRHFDPDDYLTAPARAPVAVP